MELDQDENEISVAKKKSLAGQAAIRLLSQPVKGKLFTAQILAAVSGILSIAPYVALVELGKILREGNDPEGKNTWFIILILISAYSLRLLLYFAALLLTHFTDLALRDFMRRRIAARISSAPLAWFARFGSGRVRKAIQDDTATVHTVIAHGPIEKLNAIVSPAALLIYAFIVDWRLGLISIATIPLYVGMYSLSMRGMNVKTAQMDTKLAKVSATMAEFVAGIAVVKTFGKVGQAHDAYLKAADEFSSFYRDWCRPLVNVASLSFAWVSIPVLLLVNLGGGALLIHAGYVQLEQVIATTLIALVLPSAMMTVATIAWSYQMAGSAAQRLVEIMNLPSLPQPVDPLVPKGNDIKIEDLSYSYGQTLALEEVSLDIPEGSVTALVGPSGAGKSTLATLIARFADPDKGSIRIGGVDLRSIEQNLLYKKVSFVLQDAQLIRDTVAANISLGNPDSSLEDIRKAGAAAQIDDFIMSLPKGYDTIVNEDIHLSGGQAARIAIARALIIDAPILVMDEATAMADPESEAKIQSALTSLAKGRTVVVIAHRLASIRAADQIVVMERGRISASGTHEELLDNPIYQALLKQGTAEVM